MSLKTEMILPECIRGTVTLEGIGTFEIGPVKAELEIEERESDPMHVPPPPTYRLMVLGEVRKMPPILKGKAL